MPARIRSLAVALALAACYDSSGLAEYGTVHGFAQDASNGVALAGVLVSVADTTAFTGNDGTYSIGGIRPGTYNLIATYADFTPFHQSVTVHARRNTSVALLLAPGGFSIARPAAIAAEPGHNRHAITVRWSPLEEAVNYALFWSTDPAIPPTAAHRINGVTSPFVHTALTAGTTYYYAVAGLGIVAEGPASDVVSSVPYDHIAIRVDAPAPGATAGASVTVSVRVDADDALTSVTAQLGTSTVALTYIPNFHVWEGVLPVPSPHPPGTPVLTITATDVLGRVAHANRTLRFTN